MKPSLLADRDILIKETEYLIRRKCEMRLEHELEKKGLSEMDDNMIMKII